MGNVERIYVRQADGTLAEVGYQPQDTPLPVSVVDGVSILNNISVSTTVPQPLQVFDQSNPPVQVSGGTLQGISNSVAVTQSGIWSISVTPAPVQAIQAATANGLTITGTVNTSVTVPQPLTVQAATPNGLTVTGIVTANQGAAPWSVTVSSQPVQVRDTSNQPVQVSGGTLQGISNSVAVTQSGNWNIAVTPVPVQAIQAATTNGLTITGTVSANVVIPQPLAVQAATTNGLTITGSVTQGGAPWSVSQSGTWTVAVSSEPVEQVLAASANGLTINGTVTANQGAPPWAVSISSQPIVVRDTSNPPVQISGGTLQGISNSVGVTQVGSCWTIAVTSQPAGTRAWNLNATNDGVTVTGQVTINPSSAVNGLSVIASASNIKLLSARPGRLGGLFYNDSASNMYLKLGVTASTTSYSVKLPGAAYFELPFPIYNGEIDAIWDIATGGVQITELY